MLTALLDTVESLFRTIMRTQTEDKDKDKVKDKEKDKPVFLMSFQRRDTKEGDGSAMFTTVRRVVDDVKARGWKMECLAWRYVYDHDTTANDHDNDDNDHKNDEDEDDEGNQTRKEVFIFEITP
mmetsp:Transcript_7827/g.11316  ORF Transcript_7827/g.11316 Transcript_7827/m.11316 type:complete len:124 (+) Transcript_7827:569-940(+)